VKPNPVGDSTVAAATSQDELPSLTAAA